MGEDNNGRYSYRPDDNGSVHDVHARRSGQFPSLRAGNISPDEFDSRIRDLRRKITGTRVTEEHDGLERAKVQDFVLSDRVCESIPVDLRYSWAEVISDLIIEAKKCEKNRDSVSFYMYFRNVIEEDANKSVKWKLLFQSRFASWLNGKEFHTDGKKMRVLSSEIKLVPEIWAIDASTQRQQVQLLHVLAGLCI